MKIPNDSAFFHQVRATSSMDLLVLDIKCCSNHNRDIFKFVDDFLYFEEFLYILEGSIYLQIFQACYDFLAIIDFGFNKMSKLISLNFLKPQMWKVIKDFVFFCGNCCR